MGLGAARGGRSGSGEQPVASTVSTAAAASAVRRGMGIKLDRVVPDGSRDRACCLNCVTVVTCAVADVRQHHLH
ncbi:hypothetical protein Pve01_08830 [Planomonospora venezuelensis]|nr:hypothetical protein Pve01_08830 [Planomonospora venezuelensis]